MAISTGSGKGSVNAEINVTPMIDVMLVLLIIFMIVTPVLESGFQATMSAGANVNQAPEEDDEITVGLDISQPGLRPQERQPHGTEGVALLRPGRRRDGQQSGRYGHRASKGSLHAHTMKRSSRLRQ